MAKQMGLIGAQIEAALPNATKCASWQDIQASHVSMDHVPLTIKAFFGGLSLLAFGLGSSLIGFCAEKLAFMYRGGNKGLFVLLSRTQAGTGRTVKQEQ